MMKKIIVMLFGCCLMIIGNVSAQNSNPVIESLVAEQRAGTFLVDIRYDVSDPNNDMLFVYVQVSRDSGKTFTVPARSFSGNYGFPVVPGKGKLIVWDAGADYPEQYGENFRVKLIASDLKLDRVVSIPADSFLMGDIDGLFDQQPRHTVRLNEFNIAPYAVTNGEYKIYCDLTGRAYPPEGGASQAPQGYFLNYPNYPVVGVSWYDAVRYCNWLSQQYGFAACYDTVNWSFNPSKNGFHLPTEAQWERAARGGLATKKYPWGDEDPGTRCNYQFYQGVLVDSMANFLNNRGPLPVGKFQPNGFGLYDMAGNVFEWCNDWYQEDYYSISPSQNPLGPTTGTERVIRGGAWNRPEAELRCAFRDKKAPTTRRYDLGFRIAR